MKWNVKVFMLVFSTLELVGGRDILEHALVSSALPTNVLADDLAHVYIIDGEPSEVYEKRKIDASLLTTTLAFKHPLAKVFSLAVNYRKDKLYFYDSFTKALVGISDFTYKTQFQNMPIKVLHNGVSRSSLTKIAVDYVSDNVYWVDPVFHWIAVQPGDLQGVDQSNFKILVHENLDRPTALAVSPIHGYMFWGDSGQVPKIERANLIGQDREVIISTGLLQPMAIDVDHVTSHIYWVDSARDSVETCDFNGENRKTIRRLSHSDLKDIVVLGDTITVSDYNSGRLNILDRTTGADLVSGMGATNGDKMWALCLYTPNAQPSAIDKCPARNCEHICVSQPSGATCLCKEGYRLNTDQRTCTEAEGDLHRAVIVAGSSGACMLDIRSLTAVDYNKTTCFAGVAEVNYFDIDMVADNRKMYYATDTDVYSVIIDDFANSSPVLVVSMPDTITGLACDWRDNNIYLSLRTGKLVLFSQTTSSSYTLLEDLINPRELFLLPLDSQILWISGTVGNYKIEKAAMDGTDRDTVLSPQQLSDPHSITVDPTTLMIYFTDEGRVRRCKMDGTDNVTMEIDDVSSAQLIYIYKNHLIFSDTTSTGTYIKVADVDDVEDSEAVDHAFQVPKVGTIKALKILDAHSQPSQKGPCAVFNGDCEQVCLPVGQTKVCKCEYGFTLDVNRETCSSTLIPDNFVLVTDWTHDKIYQVGLVTDIVNALDTDSISSPIGVVYNHVTKQVIWSDNQLIHRINLNGTGYEILANLELLFCFADRFAIDFSTGNIFYTAVPVIKLARLFRGVGVITPEGKHRQLVSTGSQPRDIVLDPQDGLMFWSDHGEDPFVKRAFMDGTSVDTIIDTAIIWPNGMAIEQQRKRLYISDGKLNTVQDCSYLGFCRHLITLENAHLMDVTFLGKHLYLTAWNRQHITKINVHNVSDLTVLAQKSELGRLDSLAIYKSTETTTSVTRSCQVNNGGCSTFCLPISGDSRTCACEDGVDLLSDMKTCEKVKSTQTPTTRATTTQRPGTTEKQSGGGVPIPAVAGGAAGALVLIVIIVIVVIFLCKRSQSKGPSIDPPNPYIMPIADNEEAMDSRAAAAAASEYDYIGLDNIAKKMKEVDTRRKEDDARKSANVYVDLQPSPVPQHRPAGIDFLSSTQQRPTTVNDYLSFSGRHDDSRNMYTNSQYLDLSALHQHGGLSNQLYSVDQGRQNRGFEQEDQTSPKMPRLGMPQQNDNRNWTSWDSENGHEDYMTPTPTPSVRGGYSAY